MDPDSPRAFTLTLRESMALLIGLDCYLREFSEHRQLDGGLSHPEAEWQQLQQEIGGLRARLESLGRSDD